MLTVGVQIIRFTDAAQPGWVECLLQDTSGHEWVFSDKVSIFTSVPLDRCSSFPQPGVIACEVVREWIDENNRRRCIIDTKGIWDIMALSGETQFEVFYDQIATRKS